MSPVAPGLPAPGARCLPCPSPVRRGDGDVLDYKYRFIDQPAGWLGEKTRPDVPYITNLRLDPFERTGWPNNGTKDGAQQYFDWFKYQFWRFVFVQQVVGKELQTFVEFPPMQRGASFRGWRAWCKAPMRRRIRLRSEPHHLQPRTPRPP